MSSRDLVGRPLVPFFDADENVNDALAADTTMGFESLDVDARVWNKELGYFEYPSDQTASSSDGSASAQRSQSASRRGKNASAPIAIQPKKASNTHAADSNGSYGSASRLLLTPAMMLSSSCPDATPFAHERDGALHVPADASATTRSTSAKRASKQPEKGGRSNTPARRRNKSKPSGESNDATAPGAASDAATTTSKDEKRSNKRGGRSKSKDGSSSNGQQTQPKAPKEDLSTGGKWAWSAFQSSPDPKQLPLPPFLMTTPPPPPPPLLLPVGSAPPPGEAFGNVSAGRVDRPPQPTTPPEAPLTAHPAQQPPLPPSPPPSASIEHSMTQDLRRMLNIGGG